MNKILYVLQPSSYEFFLLAESLNLKSHNLFKTIDNLSHAGRSLSEAFILASTNPQYDDRLFIELQVQYIKIPSSNLGRTCCVQNMLCTEIVYDIQNNF